MPLVRGRVNFVALVVVVCELVRGVAVAMVGRGVEGLARVEVLAT